MAACAACLRMRGVNSNRSRSRFNSISVSASWSGPRGLTGSLVSSWVISADLPVKGRIRNSALRCRSARPGHSCSSCSVSTRLTTFLTRWSGRFCKVTSDRTPNAPSPTRAAWNRSACWSRLHSATVPSGRTSRIARTSPCSAVMPLPVPWVPVAMAPARVCLLMSGRLGISCPIPASKAPSAESLVPARTVAVVASASWLTRPCKRSIERSVPSVGTRAVKLWPEPTGRIGRVARGNSAASSASLAGAARAEG